MTSSVTSATEVNPYENPLLHWCGFESLNHDINHRLSHLRLVTLSHMQAPDYTLLYYFSSK